MGNFGSGSSRRVAGPLLGGIVFDVSLEYPNYLGALVMGVGFVVSLLTLTEAGARVVEAK